jgi:hypothetical protein
VVEVIKTFPAEYTFDVLVEDKITKEKKSKSTNVEEYFLEKRVRLQHKFGPCLKVGSKGAVVPAEVNVQ